jgi:hypothetical protein
MTFRQIVTLLPVFVMTCSLIGCGSEATVEQTPAEREKIRQRHQEMSQAESGQH